MSLGFKVFLSGFFLLLLIGCAGVKQPLETSRKIPPEWPSPTTPETTPPEVPAPIPSQPVEAPRERPSPRALASLELSQQAQSLIEENRPDEAIRILEQAVNLHPGSGENYYYLAEAWRRKGNSSQASEYNNLAAIRFNDDPEWMGRIALQKKRIDRIR